MSNFDVHGTVTVDDQASDAFEEIGANSQDLVTNFTDLSASTEQVTTTTTKATTSAKDLVVGMAGLATSVFSLYNAYDRVASAQLAADKANLTVQANLRSLNDAQIAYNKALERYGEGSVEVAQKQEALTLAQDRYSLSLDDAKDKQDNVTESMIGGILQAIPTVITMVASLSAMNLTWTGVTAAATAAQTALGSALTFLAANPIVIIIAAVIAAATALYLLYQNCEPVRNAIDGIGRVLSDFFGPIVQAIGDGLNWLWTNVFVPLGGFLADYFTDVIRTLGLAWEGLGIIINLVYTGLKWMWDNVLIPLGVFIVNTFIAAWNSLGSAIQWVYNTLIKPVFDALQWAWDNILKPIGDFLGGIGDALGGVADWVGGGLNAIGDFLGLAEGGIVTGPTLALIGEAGPEAVIPLSGGQRFTGDLPGGLGGSSTNTVNFYIDRVERTVDLEAAADIAYRKLTRKLSAR